MPLLLAVGKWFIGPIAGPVLGVALALSLLGGTIAVGVYHFELANVTAELEKKKDEIDNTSTGWVARNAQCETNVSTLRTAVDRMAGDISRLADQTKADSDRLASSMATALVQVRDVGKSTEKLLARPPSAPIGSLPACVAGAKILKGGIP